MSLTNDARQRALDAISAIRASLTDFRPEWYPAHSRSEEQASIRAAIAHGFPGWALFFAHLHLATGRNEDLEMARDLLDRAIAQASDLSMNASLFEGLSGLAWTVAHFRNIGIIDAEDAIDADVDEYVLADVVASIGAHPELVAGAVGVGLYALENRASAMSAAILSEVLNAIETTALRNDDSVSWFIPHEAMSARNRKKGESGYWDFGLAHGNPGIGLFLIRAIPFCDKPRRLLDLVARLARFIIRHELPPSSPSRYPAMYFPIFEPQIPSRLAWCYGDLGVSLFLLQAGQALNDTTLLEKGIAVARDAAARPRADARVHDACICHGAAGVAQLFRRLSSFAPDLAATADRWFTETLELRRPSGGVAGFTYSYEFVDFDQSVEHAWVSNPGLLGGAAGIGLALIGAVYSVEPIWDRLFLLS